MNILTIDVEDYFQVENFKKYISYDKWDSYECRVVKNTRLILEILKKHNIKATFFVLGWVGERFPELIREIHYRGHEIASHGYAHTLIYKQTREEFEYDLLKSLEILENIINQPILGYRAPSFSIVDESLWALDIIEKSGLMYDSSIFPARVQSRYGIKNSKDHIYKLSENLYEVPPATVKLLGKRWPVAGGGYFRLYPYGLTKFFIKVINENNKRPVVAYFHPWEFDLKQPRIREADFASRFRHYINIERNMDKFERLLTDFSFTSIKDYLEMYLAEGGRVSE